AFGPEVEALRNPSTWLGEVSALACAPGEAESNFDVVIGLMRQMAQFARRHGMEHLLVAVHPRHARFYRRAMGFQRLGEERPYPTVCNRPAVAMHLDLWSLDGAPAENVMLFFGEPIADEHLRFCPISAAERRLFAPAAAYDSIRADAAASGETLACA
ncbi:MAG: N-acyl amino acid synthase FeeM domain-containing protein, partial [Pirellulales bacterium]